MRQAFVGNPATPRRIAAPARACAQEVQEAPTGPSRWARSQGGGAGGAASGASASHGRGAVLAPRREVLRRLCAGVAVGLPLAEAVAQGDGAADRQQAKFTRTASGLKLYDVVEGSGVEVEADSRVTFHYIGRLAGRQGKPFEDTCALLRLCACCRRRGGACVRVCVRERARGGERSERERE